MFSPYCIRIKIPVCKQCRPRSDAAFCGICVGTALFAYAPETSVRALVISGLCSGLICSKHR